MTSCYAKALVDKATSVEAYSLGHVEDFFATFDTVAARISPATAACICETHSIATTCAHPVFRRSEAVGHQREE